MDGHIKFIRKVDVLSECVCVDHMWTVCGP